MPTNYTTRFLLIVAIVGFALWCIFPGAFKGDFRANLKPGIDMVGGTSLLYEIKVPEGGTQGRTDLAEEVMTALKRRVDPDGVRNLVWRPQGATRLEIQMPLNRAAGESQAKRQAFADAQEALERTNVRTAEVLRAVERLSGDARREELNRLAAGSVTRDKLFGAMASVWDQIQQARQQEDAATQAQREIEYENLKAQIEDTNVSPAALENALAGQAGQQRLEEMKKQFADFPERVKALDQFAQAFAEYAPVRNALDDAGDLKRLLRGSGVLSFHIMVDYDPANMAAAAPEVREMYDRLQKRGPIAQGGDTMRWFRLDRPEEMPGQSVQYDGQSYVLAYVTADRSLMNRPGLPPWALERVVRDRDPNSGENVVSFRFDAQGARYFGDLTGNNIGRQLGIVLDERMISAPVINSKISAHGQITGNKAEGGFSTREVGYLVSMLSAGSLPARLTDEPISERTVGPQIGADNLRAGFIACAFGLVVVAFFLIGYYYVAGVVAFTAVMLNMVLILGSMAALDATFTLPGVAAIVLTIGMAVDANVLIFERLREEQNRGLSLRMALRNAYDRAFSAILDGNLTTGITAAALYVFGTEEVKGFGLTLMIGIVASLFTALYVTRTIFGVMIDHLGVENLGSLPLTFPRWDRMLRPDIDWMSKAWIFGIVSAIFIAIGVTAFGVKLAQGRMLDIEFASGTSVQFELREPMRIEAVRAIINKASDANRDALPAPAVVSVGTGNLTYEVVTPNKDAVAVRTTILNAMGDRLNLLMPSSFAGAEQPYSEAIDRQIFPITSDAQRFGEIVPPGRELVSNLGGVAVLLENVEPPLRPSEIHARLERARMQPQPGRAMQPYRELSVVSPAGDDEPTRTALVMTSDQAFPYEKDSATWAQEVAAPLWQMVNEGVAGEPSLQKVVNFDAQVAAETQREATIAIILSIVGIMAYVWLRFGNLKYGTATVVALAHDTLAVIAAIGFAHLLADTWIGTALLIEPFRINLTVVAAVLTVMGYSMNDTVVIFDRIRENRGKVGVLSRRVINDSINQTLSRTLLTGGTTMLTILVMYVWGGAGIHGFTYALLIGILVGTYSSLAIASPILLIGSEKVGEEARRSPEPVGQLQRA